MQMARSKKACLVFFDEIDAIGGARFDDGAGWLALVPPAAQAYIILCMRRMAISCADCHSFPKPCLQGILSSKQAFNRAS